MLHGKQSLELCTSTNSIGLIMGAVTGLDSHDLVVSGVTGKAGIGNMYFHQ